MDDPRLWVLKEALASYASDLSDPPIGESDILQAAVSVVIRAGDRLDLLLIKRAQHEGDPWSGHMALPGGRRDVSDGSLVDTAVRETFEETGVELLHELRLGALEEVAPSSSRLPRLTIQPYVFGVTASASAHVASPEVDEVHWVTLHELRHPETRGEVEIVLPGGSRTFPCLRMRGEVVWGLTYRILDEFLRLYPDAALEGID